MLPKAIESEGGVLIYQAFVNCLVTKEDLLELNHVRDSEELLFEKFNLILEKNKPALVNRVA
eukprot:CAMPEP_0202971206 /NCGR_PEP_ID=MMETSP1396-20130829/24840_1 /ASSEMBLY_ACC=CAM_ASM_000872 /TAXON_ID= /ORGANISM="Pseudokeronopsis sp., Strain Brazil" /LENGTH=61 /DNA_ID=CAMNT_0049700375 /DNA_START=1825 /DNA_END=2007 /DNA_ORIENTATION=+